MCCPKTKTLPLVVLRQPPPQIRGTMDTLLNTVIKTEEHNPDQRGSNWQTTRTYYFRKCKKRKIFKPATNIESLPVDVLFEILVRVPAQDIYNATRLVCRKWYKIIHTRHFIHAHLQQSPCGLLAQGQGSKRYELTFIASGNDEIEMSKVNYEVRHKTLSSCNGLLLEHHDNFKDLYITNPATKQHFALPPFFLNLVPYGNAIAFAPTSFEYKVVCTFFHPSDDFRSRSRKFGPQDDCVAILTVGVDKDWTCRVSTQHLSPTTKELLLLDRPLTTEGFVHWAKNDSHSEHVLTLNVETEVMTLYRVPASLSRHDGESEVIYLPMGSSLSLFILRSELSWEVWEMKPKTGEWAKMPNIDLEPHFTSSLYDILTPVGWSRSREVLVFSVREGTSRSSCYKYTFSFLAFNVRTCELQNFTVDSSIDSFLAHRNSLVWMDGC